MSKPMQKGCYRKNKCTKRNKRTGCGLVLVSLYSTFQKKTRMYAGDIAYIRVKPLYNGRGLHPQCYFPLYGFPLFDGFPVRGIISLKEHFISGCHEIGHQETNLLVVQPRTPMLFPV